VAALPVTRRPSRTWRPRDPVQREVAALLQLARQLPPAGQRAFCREVERMLAAAERGVTPEQYAKGKR
jgi:hypothetical protein